MKYWDAIKQQQQKNTISLKNWWFKMAFKVGSEKDREATNRAPRADLRPS